MAVASPNNAPGDTIKTALVQLQECDNGLKVSTWPQNPPDPNLIEQLLDVLDKVQSREALCCKLQDSNEGIIPSKDALHGLIH